MYNVSILTLTHVAGTSSFHKMTCITFFFLESSAFEGCEDVLLFLNEDAQLWNQATQRRETVDSSADAMSNLCCAQTWVNEMRHVSISEGVLRVVENESLPGVDVQVVMGVYVKSEKC